MARLAQTVNMRKRLKHQGREIEDALHANQKFSENRAYLVRLCAHRITATAAPAIFTCRWLLWRFCRMNSGSESQPQISILHQAQEPRGSGIEMQMRAWNTLLAVILDVESVFRRRVEKIRSTPLMEICAAASRARHSNNQI